MQQKKIPVRHCLGCGEGKPKKQLIRVVRAPDGGLSIDSRGKAPGRGAYLCPSVACFQKARKAKRLERALERPIPDELYEQLAGRVREAEEAADEE